MQPEVVLLADVGDFVDGVESAEDGRAGRRVHEERNLAIRNALHNEAFQFRRNHLAPALRLRLRLRLRRST